MNKIRRIGEQKWEVICENGQRIEANQWFEKKTGKWHVKLPAENSTGRTYIRVERLPQDGSWYEFETKTEHRENMGWKDRMTNEEKAIWKECETKMADIKRACEARRPEKLEKNTEEWYEAEIARLTAKLTNLRRI